MNFQRCWRRIVFAALILGLNAAMAIADEVEDLVAAYLRFPRDVQRDITERLIRDRLDPALRATLDAEELADEQQFTRKVLDRAALGQTLTEKGFRKTLKKIDLFEQMMVLDLSRDYRTEANRAFADDPRAYQRRIAAWSEVEGLWKQAGESIAGRPLLIDWLRQAIARFQRGETTRLPARPNFVAADMFGKTPRNTNDRPPAGSQIAASRAPQPGQRSTSASTERPRDKSMATAKNGADAKSGATAAGEAKPSARAAALPTEATQVTAQPPLPGPDRPTPNSPDPEWKSRPTPFSAKPSRSTSSGKPGRPNAATTSTRHAATSVNLTELEARIAGFNSAVASFHARLAKSRHWTIDELTVAVDDLATLAVRRSDLQLYWNLLSESERHGLAELRSIDLEVAAMQAKISTAKKDRATNIDDPVNDEDTRRHLLDELAKRLATLGGERGKGV